MICLHRRKSALFDTEAQSRRTRDRPHHSDRVFLKTDFRIADGADDLLLDVLHAADPVDDRKIPDVVKKAVYREIATIGIGLRCAEGIVLERSFGSMLYDLADRLGILAEGCRFDDFTAELDVSETEAATDQETISESVLHFYRFCAGPDVKILRLSANKQIPHAASDKVRGIPES